MYPQIPFPQGGGGVSPVALMVVSSLVVLFALVVFITTRDGPAGRVVSATTAVFAIVLFGVSCHGYRAENEAERRATARQQLASAVPGGAPVEVLRATVTAGQPAEQPVRLTIVGYSPIDTSARTPRALWDADLLTPAGEDLLIGVGQSSECIDAFYVAESPRRIEVVAILTSSQNLLCSRFSAVTTTYYLIDLSAPVGDREIVGALSLISSTSQPVPRLHLD